LVDAWVPIPRGAGLVDPSIALRVGGRDLQHAERGKYCDPRRRSHGLFVFVRVIAFIGLSSA
jgi:hypothetical protein